MVERVRFWRREAVYWNVLWSKCVLQRLEFKGCHACSSDGVRSREQRPVHSTRVYPTRGLERLQGNHEDMLLGTLLTVKHNRQSLSTVVSRNLYNRELEHGRLPVDIFAACLGVNLMVG